jgi:uncharacterized membrane protein
MAAQRTTSERLAAFSDGVFAVIITIMVLDLRPPPQPTLAALLPLWPASLSYAVSYLFIAIGWVNHHHLLRFAEHATPRLIWGELRAPVHGVAGTVLDRVGRGYSTGGVPVFVYAAVFVLVNLAYCVFVWETLAQAEVEVVSARMRRITLTRSFLTLGMFVIAMLLSLKFPWWGFGSVCCVLLVYLWPEFHI